MLQLLILCQVGKNEVYMLYYFNKIGMNRKAVILDDWSHGSFKKNPEAGNFGIF
ncbi:hypothetical protein SAMN05421877_11033 [Sphingobacterium lactis]|uniref:Uncharacterized protein n=1 Tax=Sphingobacterium lactis TaxID=797291 RepID=A0A1H6BCZ9_9SPHI|nr:hypothetical protein SAMN05421877_11033 [Sphingobacterium lactis]